MGYPSSGSQPVDFMHISEYIDQSDIYLLDKYIIMLQHSNMIMHLDPALKCPCVGSHYSYCNYCNALNAMTTSR